MFLWGKDQQFVDSLEYLRINKLILKMRKRKKKPTIDKIVHKDRAIKEI